jgi:hypothetical protein
MYFIPLGVVAFFAVLYSLSLVPKKGVSISEYVGVKSWMWVVGLIALVVVWNIARNSSPAPSSAMPPTAIQASEGSQILEGSGPFRAAAGKKTLWINTVGRWIHIVPGNGNFTYELQDGNGKVRTFRSLSGYFYEVLPDGRLDKLADQSGILWRQAIYERFTSEEDATFIVDSHP